MKTAEPAAEPTAELGIKPDDKPEKKLKTEPYYKPTAKPTAELTVKRVTKPKSRDGYTIGWVCTLLKEQTAAKAMLDKMNAAVQKRPRTTPTATVSGL
ncbi:hypothetical protein GGI43DRAFT_399369 [Trichoderma evansii]